VVQEQAQPLVFVFVGDRYRFATFNEWDVAAVIAHCSHHHLVFQTTLLHSPLCSTAAA
jgi:hypothetical protein